MSTITVSSIAQVLEDTARIFGSMDDPLLLEETLETAAAIREVTIRDQVSAEGMLKELSASIQQLRSQFDDEKQKTKVSEFEELDCRRRDLFNAITSMSQEKCDRENTLDQLLEQNNSLLNQQIRREVEIADEIKQLKVMYDFYKSVTNLEWAQEPLKGYAHLRRNRNTVEPFDFSSGHHTSTEIADTLWSLLATDYAA